jgi:hypothetical protein
MGLFTRAKPAPKSVPSPASNRPATAPQNSHASLDSGAPVPLLGDAVLERSAQEHALRILKSARSSSEGVLSAAFWSDKLMAWSMRDPDFKVQLFHFVDCFPALRNSDLVYEHLVDFMSKPGLSLPPGMDFGL